MNIQRLVIRYTLLALALWSLLVGASAAWNANMTKRETVALATNTAHASFNKDQAYRLWATSHGGVYVEPDARTPPSPYMAHIPDRDVVTTDGKRLTLMNPAFMLRQMMEEFGELYGIRGKITGHVVLNPINLPDEWEKQALDAFDRGAPEVLDADARIDGQPHLRLMRPMVMQEGCLKCHGHLGFKVGDIRGGVGISVPLAPYRALEAERIRTMELSHAGFWLLGCVGIVMIGRRSGHRLQEREDLIDELSLSAEVFENGLDGIIITDHHGTILRVNPMFTTITGYTAEEAIGTTPRLLKSDHHSPDFYQELWARLLAEGRWEGEIWNRHKNGEGFAAWESISSVRSSTGATRYYISMFHDITEQKASEAHIHHLAHYDVLTGLPNRLLFTDRLEHAVRRAERGGERVALLFLDLDLFKTINDSLGHPAGDRLLVTVGERLRHCLRNGDTVARLGGDEFVVVLEEGCAPATVEQVASKLLAALTIPIDLAGHTVHVSASIGVSLYPQDGRDADTLLKNADTAMYRAKESGRNRLQFYDPAMGRKAEERLELEGDMRLALERGEFVLHYQPQVAAADGTLIGAEALVRWRHPTRGMVPPDHFIPLAEETGLILPLGQWVLEEACRAAAVWNRDAANPLRIAVNLSGVQIKHTAIVATVAAALRDSGLDPSHLELEVTEGFVMSSFDDGLGVLKALRNLGVSLSIDDFGTGYSSLAYLKRLPIDRLKIDRAFIAGLPDDDEDRVISTTIINMGRSLRLQVIAEGVETEAQRAFLREQGCDEIQGYLISRPVPREEFTQLLAHARG